jgi:hypothetical protein
MDPLLSTCDLMAVHVFVALVEEPSLRRQSRLTMEVPQSLTSSSLAAKVF